MVGTGQNSQLILSLLHKMCIPECNHCLQDLSQILWVLANYMLRWIRVQHDDQQVNARLGYKDVKFYV